MKPLPRAQGADPVVVVPDIWNRLCDMVERANSLTVTHPLALSGSDTGIALSSKIIAGSFSAVLYSHGPDDESDFGNEMYWAYRSFPDPEDSITDDPATETTHFTTSYSTVEPAIVPATNFGEAYLDKEAGGIEAHQSGTHLLEYGTHVQVFFEIDPRGNRRYFFNYKPEILALVTSNAAGGGKYYGSLIARHSTSAVTAAGNLIAADFGTSAGACLILNGAELGQSTHDLTSGTPISKYFPGVRGPRKSDENLHVVGINGYDFQTCTDPPSSGAVFGF